MMVNSKITLEATQEYEDFEQTELTRTKVFIVLNPDEKEIIENDNVMLLKYNNENPSRRYSHVGLSDLFEHYMDSYDIKIFKIFETLGYIPDMEMLKGTKLEFFDLLDTDEFKKFKDNNNIEIHLVTANGIELGYLVKDGSCDKDDLANFYFINEWMARNYFRIYFGYGKFPLKNGLDIDEDDIPKPIDIESLVTYYCPIDDVIFNNSMMLLEFVKFKEEVE